MKEKYLCLQKTQILVLFETIHFCISTQKLLAIWEKFTNYFSKNHPKNRRKRIGGKLSILIEIWSTSLVLSWDKIKEITTFRTGHRLINFTDNYTFWINYLQIEMMIMSSHEELSARWIRLDNCWKRNHW